MSEDENLDYYEYKPEKPVKTVRIKVVPKENEDEEEGFTKYSKAELEMILEELAEKEFQREKENLRREFEKRGLDTTAFDLVENPSQLEKLREKLENAPKVKRSYVKTYPSGHVKLPNFGQQTDDDISSWYHREFNTQKDMLDFLYEKAEHGTPRERKEAEKILNQLFKNCLLYTSPSPRD